MAEYILTEILNSRRLLSDHVEIVAVTLDQLQKIPKDVSYNGYGKCSVLVSGVSLLAACSWNRLFQYNHRVQVIPIALALGWGCYVASTWCGKRLAHDQLVLLRRFIEHLSAFDVAVRRNVKIVRVSGRFTDGPAMTYNEISLHMKCVQSEIVIIRALCEAVQTLEQHPLPYELLEVYQNIESLNECELFQRPFASLKPQHNKDFYQIFQYVQSQLLARFCLAVVHNPEAAQLFMRQTLKKLSRLLSIQLRLDAEVHQSLSASDDLQTILNQRRTKHIGMVPIDHKLFQLRGLSLDVVAKFLAIATSMRRLDNIVHSATGSNLDSIRNQSKMFEQIEVALGECVEDYRKLFLTYNRLILGTSNDLEAAAEVDALATLEGIEAEAPKFSDMLVDKEPESEFYALLERDLEVDEDQSESVRQRSSQDDEISAIDSRVVKRHFKPVLRQLKDRLEPINVAMRDREKKFLEEKGIDAELNETSKPNMKCGGSDSDADELDDFGRLRKKKKPTKNYDEVRRFLEAKQQISLMSMHGSGMLPLPRPMIEEDILE